MRNDGYNFLRRAEGRALDPNSKSTCYGEMYRLSKVEVVKLILIAVCILMYCLLQDSVYDAARIKTKLH